MGSISPRNLIQQLIFGGPATSDVEAIEANIDALDSERPQTGSWPSAYVVVLQETINTVFEHEKHLLTEYELDAIARWDYLSYFSQYCLARLLNRKPNQWHALSSLEGFRKEVVGEKGLEICIAGICVPFAEMLKTESQPSQEPERKSEPIVKEEDGNFIDLTLSDEEDVKPTALPDDEPPYDNYHTNAEAGPSKLPPIVEDPAQIILNSNPAQLNLDFFCEDESKMTLPEILQRLHKDCLKDLARQTKCAVSSTATKPAIIEALLANASTQSILDFNTHKPSKGKGKVHNDGLRQTTLPFASTRKQRPKVSQLDRLRTMALKLLGKCVRVNFDFFRLVRRLHVIYFRSNEHPTGTLFLPALLTRFKKRTYADYTPKRDKNIWSSREELLEYEQALELRMVLEEAVNPPSPPTGGWGRGKTKTPAPVKKEKEKEKFVTPAPGRADVAPLKTPRSSTSVRFAETPGVKQEGEEVGAGGMVEEEGDDEVIITEDEKVLKARIVKKYYEDWLQAKWDSYLAVKQEPGLQPRAPALERFEPGWMYTSMVYKVAKALATLKEFAMEEEVLNALLAQRIWRRGKRAAWYERRALIQTNYLCKGEPEALPNGKRRAPIDERVLQRAVDGLYEALEDDDVGLVWRPGFVRRLQKLEKRLKIEPEQCIQVTGTLRIAAVVEFAAKRCDKSLKLDSNGRPIKEKENTPVGVDSYFPPVGGCKQEEKPPKEKWRPTGKSVWEGRDREEVTVEMRALQYYEDMGFKGFHSETLILTTIFALLFWDIIFADIPGAFETPYQSAPLDMTEDSFYYARKELIEERLIELREDKAKEILEKHDDKYRPKETWCVGVRWDLCAKEDLVEIVECLGGESLAIICRLFCDDYGGRSSGVPDLIVWNAQDGVCKFVEVKGPGDRLQENQKLWSDTLLRANTEVEVCKVLDASKPIKSTPMKRKRKSKTPASTNKSKRRKPVVANSEDERDYDQLDRHPESEDEDVLPQYDDGEPPPKKRRRTVEYERKMEVDDPLPFAFASTATPPTSPPRLSPEL